MSLKNKQTNKQTNKQKSFRLVFSLHLGTLFTIIIISSSSNNSNAGNIVPLENFKVIYLESCTITSD